MSKTKLYILAIIFLCFIVGITIASIRTAEAETSTTFPVGEAGIAAYAKLDNIENIDLEVFANACDSIEELGESYIVGTIKIENAVGFSYPHIYVGADGWIVAYYLKTEEVSRIMQWKGYTAGSINTTTLKDAIDHICAKIGVTYSPPVKYYDFAFPESNKMVLIVDSNDFYVTVPGTLYEASYGVLLKDGCCSGFVCRILKLTIDENLVYESPGLGCWYTCSGPFSSYGYYDLSVFPTGITHHIIFHNGCSDWSPTSSAVTALIYKN